MNHWPVTLDAVTNLSMESYSNNNTIVAQPDYGLRICELSGSIDWCLPWMLGCLHDVPLQFVSRIRSNIERSVKIRQTVWG